MQKTRTFGLFILLKSVFYEQLSLLKHRPSLVKGARARHTEKSKLFWDYLDPFIKSKERKSKNLFISKQAFCFQ